MVRGERRGDVGGSTRRRETAASGEETERGGRDARARRAGMACGAKGDGAAGMGGATAHKGRGREVKPLNVSR